MAIAVDSTSKSNDTTQASSTLSWTHTVGSSLLNSILIVPVQVRDPTDANRVVTGVTYNSVSLTKIRNDAANPISTELWYLKSPSSGAHSVVVTLTASCAAVTADAVSFSGVDQTSPIDTSAGTTGIVQSSTSVSITTGCNNAMLVDSAYMKIGTACTAGASQTGKGNNYPLSSPASTANGTGDTTDASYKTLVSLGATTMSWSWTGSDDWSQSVVSLKPFVAGVAVVLPVRSLLGVGL